MIARKQFSRIGWAFVAFCLVDLGVQMVFGAWIGVWMLLRDMETLNIDFLLLAQISMYVFAFPIFWILMRQIPAWKKPEGESLGIGQFLLWAVVCFGLTYLGNFAGQIVMKISELVTGSFGENPVLDMIPSGPDRGVRPLDSHDGVRCYLWHCPWEFLSVFLCKFSRHDLCLSLQQHWTASI